MVRTLIPVLFLAAIPGRGESRDEDFFQKDVFPLLEEYCFDCHADGSEKGDLDFDAYPDYETLLKDWDLWNRIDLQLASHVMPPAKKPAPSPGQRDQIRRWIDDEVFFVDPERPDPGPVVVRRLNRAEYNNAIRDILRIDSRPANSFPPDDSAHGFDHIGSSFSLLWFEKHLRTATEIAKEATQLKPFPQAGALIRDQQFQIFEGKAERKDQLVLLGDGECEVGAEISLPTDGLYRIKLRAASTKPGGEAASFEIFDDGEPILELVSEHEYKGKRQYWDAAFALVELQKGTRRFSVRLANPGPKGDGHRIAAIHTFAIQGPFAPVPPQSTAFLDWLIGDGRALGIPVLGLSGEDFERGEGKSSLDTGKSWFSTNGYRFTDIALTEAGRYRFRVKAGAQQAGDEPVKFEIRLGGRTLAQRKITDPEQRARWIEFEADCEPGEHEMQVWFVNELLDEAGNGKRLLWLHEMEIAGPLEKGEGLTIDELPPLMEKAGRLIYRRPMNETDWSNIASLAGNPGSTPLENLRTWVRSALASPKFIYLGRDAEPTGPAKNGSAPADEFTLASRLSFFLWSSCPDEELLALAEAGHLREGLPAQISRMLTDSRSEALTENFAGQWLQLRDLENAVPDSDRFPEFTTALAAAMRRETEALFRHILAGNHSLLEFLSADYTFAEPLLAQFYGLESGDPISLKGTTRRGILTHASLLTLTSHPTRTSPVNRGKFVLEKLLGTPPPPAPSEVPPLEDAKVDPSAGLREQLESHRENARCASCHAFLDPIGLGLENFDAIGRWRDVENGTPIDASGKLVTGETFDDFGELQRLLVETKRDQFVKNFAEQLLIYALGRGLEVEDKLAVREIVRRAEADDFRFQSIIRAICDSVPFQKLRNPRSP